ncbi:MAG: hypothetical protein ACE5E0_03855 [Terriglobia bacterium]
MAQLLPRTYLKPMFALDRFPVCLECEEDISDVNGCESGFLVMKCGYCGHIQRVQAKAYEQARSSLPV